MTELGMAIIDLTLFNMNIINNSLKFRIDVSNVS